MHFGENQLSPRSFGISPLPTAHPSILNHRWVRASSPHYRTFTLAMGSSRGFGSTPCHQTPCSDSLSLRLRPLTALTYATRSNSPAHSSIGTPSRLFAALTACRRTVSGSFHPPSGVLFTFPSRYWFTIGRHEYSALEGGPPSFPRNSTCSAVLRCPIARACHISPTGLSPAPADLPRSFDYAQAAGGSPAGLPTGSYNPHNTTPAGLACCGFGLRPRSLTTTWGISVDFFSSGY
jgi:hypothetical protein